MKFLFIIQGEGRGHMTQAISLAQILQRNGYEVCASCIGKSHQRIIPDFVFQKLKSPIHLFESPNFIVDKNHKGIKLGKTISYNLSRFNTFRKSLVRLHQLVNEYEPDIILNFYDMLGGLYNAIYRPKCQFWVIGHQYLIHHPQFSYPSKKIIQKFLFQLNTWITAWGSEQRFALSFRPLRPAKTSNVQVMPPLLRKELKDQNPTTGNFYLTYMVNPGYGDEVMVFAKNNPEINILAFWDKKGAPENFRPLPNLIFQKVNDNKFLEKMAACKGLICTAGFESVCEAMYLGKPVMMVPVEGQYEQSCNALDAAISGAGIISNDFDFNKFESFLDSGQYQPPMSKSWMDSFEMRFFRLLHNTNQHAVPEKEMDKTILTT